MVSAVTAAVSKRCVVCELKFWSLRKGITSSARATNRTRSLFTFTHTNSTTAWPHLCVHFFWSSSTTATTISTPRSS